MAKHIYDLFAERPETVRATRWACVIKEGKLVVVRRLMVMPTDTVVTESILGPDQAPSWLSIYCGVWRNWRKLAAIEI
ncbi:MAG: hypothetical protein ACYS1A_14135 [Planctomycetota bacterium]